MIRFAFDRLWREDVSPAPRRSLTGVVRAGCGLLVAALALTACTSAGRDGPASQLVGVDGTGVLFVTQNTIPNAVMEALFQGRVLVDLAGCLRLGDADTPMVVWPKDFRLDEELRVRNDVGVVVGRIGESFSLGGGQVSSLHDGINVSAADRQRAEARCPGRYWIVGEIPSSTASPR